MFGDALHTTDAIRKPNSVVAGSKTNTAQSMLEEKIDEPWPRENKRGALSLPDYFYL
jgi:hypothetical protein